MEGFKICFCVRDCCGIFEVELVEFCESVFLEDYESGSFIRLQDFSLCVLSSFLSLVRRVL